jgi:hypothetical protein
VEVQTRIGSSRIQKEDHPVEASTIRTTATRVGIERRDRGLSRIDLIPTRDRWGIGRGMTGRNKN